MNSLQVVLIGVGLWIGVFVLPWWEQRDALRAQAERERAHKRRCREHFTRTEEFRRAFHPTFDGLNAMGRALAPDPEDG